MTFNNSINDTIIRIKNSCRARKNVALVKKSKLCIEILKILRTEGYIKGFKIEKYSIIVLLKYFQDKSVIKDIVSYSSSNRRNTVSFNQLKGLSDSTNKKTNGLKLNILSTSLGVLSDYSCLSNKIGGKLLLIII
jgi:small subunit ribosomal protein S8